MTNYVGMTTEELINKGFKLVEKNCEDYDIIGDVYSAYYGAMVLVVDNKVIADLDD